MKKIILAMAFFGVMSSCFCQEIYYEIKADSTIFKDTIVFKNSFLNKENEIASLKQGTKVKYSEGDDYSLFGFIDDDFFSVINVTTMNGEGGTVVLDNLKLLSKNFMPKDIIDRRWICSYYYDILLSNTKETIFQYIRQCFGVWNIQLLRQNSFCKQQRQYGHFPTCSFERIQQSDFRYRKSFSWRHSWKGRNERSVGHRRKY